MKVSNITSAVKKSWSEGGKLLSNTEHFVEATCLLVLAYAGFWTAQNVDLRTEYKWVLLFAAVIVGMRGAIEFIKHINKK